jgi:hypothetical protein
MFASRHAAADPDGPSSEIPRQFRVLIFGCRQFGIPVQNCEIAGLTVRNELLSFTHRSKKATRKGGWKLRVRFLRTQQRVKSQCIMKKMQEILYVFLLGFSPRTLMESLILAQDERWRRA